MAEKSRLVSNALLSGNGVIASDGNTITVHIEVCQKPESILETFTIEDAIDKYLLNEEEFALNKVLYNTVLPDDINYFRIYSSEELHKVNFLTQSVKKHYHIYQTWQDQSEVQCIYHENERVPALLNWCLPNTAFEGLWESLVLENGLKEQLISYIQTTLLYSNKQVNAQMILWNGIVLLHGPPGTGKTSLCKALAQKLSIRLNSKYTTSRLVEINSNTLFSKWFSESSKLICKAFSLITSWLQSQDHFVCIIIDEVESLLHSRTSGRNDPSDAIRVVNTVLTEIDQLQRYPNFLILATSNLASVIDSAFADRADLKLLVPYPSKWAIYEILKSCIEELISHDLVKGNKNDFFDRLIFRSMALDITESNGTINEIIKNSNALLRTAQLCDKLSGRTLRKIPFLTSVKFINQETPSIEEFLNAMKDVIKSCIRKNCFGL